jgi:hypothetical protein
MDQTETLIAQSHQCIRESYLAIRYLCASVARANEAIAKSLKIIEQHRVSAPAMMDRADQATPVRDHHQVSRKAAIGTLLVGTKIEKVGPFHPVSIGSPIASLTVSRTNAFWFSPALHLLTLDSLG